MADWFGVDMAKRTAEERFWEKVDRSGGPDACWPWTASTRRYGYGQFSDNGRPITAAKWILGHLRGAPLRWDDDVRELACHRCDNPPCVNPAHLYVGTHKANTADMFARGRANRQRPTHCKQGHEFTPENTYMTKRGGQSCNTCRRQRQRRGLRTIRVYP